MALENELRTAHSPAEPFKEHPCAANTYAGIILCQHEPGLPLGPRYEFRCAGGAKSCRTHALTGLNLTRSLIEKTGLEFFNIAQVPLFFNKVIPLNF